MATAPFGYTRRFFEEEEVILSSCNYCFQHVGEASHEEGLEILEQQHSCAKMWLTNSSDDEDDRVATFADYADRSLASLST